MVVTVALSIA